MEPSRAHKLGALLLAALLIGLQLRSMLGPWEDWPFTSAPMFAVYHVATRPLYEIAIIEVHADGSERRLRAADLGLRELSFGRYFFGEVYGSTDEQHPAGHHPNDDSERFAARMADVSGRLIAIRGRAGVELSAIRYELLRVDADGIQPLGAIGRYDAAAQRFRRGS